MSRYSNNKTTPANFSDPQSILNNAPIGVFCSTPDGRYTSVNHAKAAMLGYDNPQELVSSITDIASQVYANPEDRNEFMRLMEKHGELINHECRLRRRDGTEFWVSINAKQVLDNNGRVESYHGFTTDITKQKQAEQKLSETSLELSTILDSVPVMIWRKDQDGKYIHANRLFCDVVGKEIEDIAGKSDFDIHPKEIAMKYLGDDQLVLSSGKPLRNISERHKKSTGQTGWSLTEKLPCCDKDGNISGTIGFALDITDIKQAEKALQESEERFRLLIETMAEGIVLKDSSDRYVHWNKTASEIFGIDISEVAGNTTESFKRQIIREDGTAFHKDDLPSLHTLRTGEPCENVVMGIRRGPQDLVWIKANTRPYFKSGHDKPDGVVISFADITRLKRSEERVKHLNAVLQAYSTVNRIMVQARDMKNLLQEICQALISTRGYYNAWIILLDSDGNVTHWGQAGLDDEFPQLLARFQEGRMTDQAHSVMSSHLLQVVIDPRNECRDCPLAQTYAGRSSLSVRLEVEGFVLGLLTVSIPKDLARDGEEHELFTSLAGTIAQGIQRIRLEEIRRTQRVRLKNYERIISRVSDPMSLVDREYRYIVVNDAYRKQYNKPHHEIEGHTVESLIGKDVFVSKVKPHLDKALAGQEVVYDDSFPGRDGSLQYKTIHYYPFHDREGVVSGVVATTRDITVRKRAENNIRAMNEQLQKVNAEKDKLFSIIAHDLKSPMAGVYSTSEALAKDAAFLSQEEISLISAEMHKSSKNALELLNDLMQWARMSQGGMDFSPEECSLSELVNSSLYTARDVAQKKDIAIRCDIPRDLAVMVDHSMINTVIRNVIFNAVKFTHPGGNISITASQTGPDVQVCISDNGIGMSEAILSAAFYVDKSKRQLGTDGEKGTGLGLVLCKDFVEQHGGRIWLESEQGMGTKVFFTLPGVPGER